MARKQVTPERADYIYSVLHVTRPKGTLCGLPGDRLRNLKLGAAACEECLRLLEAELATRVRG